MNPIVAAEPRLLIYGIKLSLHELLIRKLLAEPSARDAGVRREDLMPAGLAAGYAEMSEAKLHEGIRNASRCYAQLQRVRELERVMRCATRRARARAPRTRRRATTSSSRRVQSDSGGDDPPPSEPDDRDPSGGRR